MSENRRGWCGFATRRTPEGPAIMAAGEIAMTFRRTVMYSAGIGACAGVMGTYFEMSHGVVCIPVLALPPMAIPHHIAVGSTVVGVAARSFLSTTLFALDPQSNLDSVDDLEEIIDVNGAGMMAFTGCAAAWSSAAVATRLTPLRIRRANGLFLIAVSVFLTWREGRVQASVEKAEKAAAAQTTTARPGMTPSRPEPGMSLAATAELHLPEGPSRFLILGAASGVVLGMFGVGPAWIVAPCLLPTQPVSDAQKYGGAAPGGADGASSPYRAEAQDVLSTSGCLERERRTASLAMLPPTLIAAARHMQLGHCPNIQAVALPLAVGAVAGSAVGGYFLEDVECDEEVKLGLSVLLFAHGAWSLFKPSG